VIHPSGTSASYFLGLLIGPFDPLGPLDDSSGDLLCNQEFVNYVSNQYGDHLSLYQDNPRSPDTTHRVFPILKVQEKDINRLLFKSNIPDRDRKCLAREIVVALSTAATHQKLRSIWEEMNALYSCEDEEDYGPPCQHQRELTKALEDGMESFQKKVAKSKKQDLYREAVRLQTLKLAQRVQPRIDNFFTKRA